MSAESSESDASDESYDESEEDDEEECDRRNDLKKPFFERVGFLASLSVLASRSVLASLSVLASRSVLDDFLVLEPLFFCLPSLLAASRCALPSCFDLAVFSPCMYFDASVVVSLAARDRDAKGLFFSALLTDASSVGFGSSLGAEGSVELGKATLGCATLGCATT